jgi:signal transduction histidine kinase/ActR/RegA family two-component response regulator
MDSAAANVVQPVSTMASGPLQRVDDGSRALRFRLFLLAASGLAPLALVLFLASAYLAQERRTDTQRSALELSRALATAVDAELGSTISLLENLAISSDLQSIAPARLATEDFARLAQRMAQSQKWMMIVVTDERGDAVAREGPLAPQARSTVEPESLARVWSTGAPVVGRVVKGPGGPDAFAVRIPVAREGRLRYVLSAVVSTDRILDVVARRRVTPSWVAAVYDQGGNVVASSRAGDALRYPASLDELVKAGGDEGAGITRTVDGVETYTGFSRVRSSQWVVAVGIPADAANADLRRVIAAVGAGTAASLGLLAWLAWRTARGISGPIDMLKRAAADLGAGKQVALRPLGVEELDEVGWALRQAAIDRDDANDRRTKVEAEREHLLVQLEQALHVAEQANRNKDEFLALLGHELRNPLAPILNAVHLIGLKDEDRTLPERRIIQRQLSYVTRMVDDLLDASRITSNRFQINLRPLRVVPVLEQTVEAQRPSFGERTVNLRIDDAARGEWVRADEARLVQVFNNILGNAIKFTAPTGAIDIEARRVDRSIEIVFRDNGAGMSMEHVRHAFDLFWQAPNRQPAAVAGLGLGLAIVRSLVEMHAGTVQAHSDGVGHGMVITITLPVGEPPNEEPMIPRMNAGMAPTRVLVVDDNEDAADTLSMLLDASGFVVRVAYTPQSALDAVTSFQPEIVLMDIGLPEMDGYEVARRLRSGDRPFGGRLVALTGYGQERDVRRAHDAGFDAHLTKPVEPETLFDLLARLAASRPPA